jgi:uncharacterized protein YoaH (UPF0181 family)
MRDNSTLGTKLAPKVAHLVTQSVIYSHSRLMHLKHKLAMMVFHAISDEISSEVDTTLGPVLAKLHDLTPEDHPAYPAIHFLHTGSGQLKALAGTGLQISGLLGAISTVLNNELAPVVYTYVKSNPHLLPDASTILQMGAAGLLPPAEVADALGQQGINSSWANLMMTLAKTWPDVTTALDLVRRKVITPDILAEWAGLNGVDETVVGYLQHLVTLPVSPADAALALLRSDIGQAEAEAIASESGINAASFNILVGNTGEPPGLQQLLEGYRRGLIDQATLERGIKQSRYRNEWIPLLEKLRFEPMSVADAVNATVQDQLDAGTARTFAEQNGLQPGAFDILLNTAGEPLSRTEMEQLYNRGIVTQQQVNQALRESRVKNKYVDLAFQLHQKIIPIFSIQSALRYGGITDQRAIESLMAEGYSHADAVAIVSSAAKERLKAFRDKVVASAEQLYEDNLITDVAARDTIMSMGFTSDEVDFIIKAAELRRQAKLIESGVNAVRSKFLAHHLSENAASGLLDGLGVPAVQRDQLLAVWILELQAFTRELTPAQIEKAVKLQLITPDDGLARLQRAGYSADDAALLLNGA